MPLPPISSGSGGRQPGTPTIGTATAGNASASVTFTAPSYLGKPTGTTYTATSTPSDISGTSSTSPITVSGLSNGTAYTFKVKLGNGVATSLESASSNSATPVAPPPPPVTTSPPPPPPPSLTVSGVTSTNPNPYTGSVVVSWSSTAQQYASITVGPTTEEIVGTGTSVTISGLSASTSYSANVTVYSACCPPSGSTASAQSASFTTSAPTPPPPPIIATPPPIIATPPPIIATPPSCDCVFSDGGDTYSYYNSCGTIC